jgi:hypothetical protein
MALFAVLLAPISYVAMFSYRASARSIAQRSHARRSVVYAAIRSGILFGVLFGLLIVGSIAVLWCRDVLDAFVLNPNNTSTIVVRGALLGAFILLHYFFIGAATGGLVGIAVDVASRWRFPQFVSTSQKPNS